MSERPFSAHWLALQPLKAQRTAIQALNPDQLLKLRHEWSWWARDEQKPPPGGWRVWLYLAGTRCWKDPQRGRMDSGVVTQGPTVVIMRGTSYQNRANLAGA